MCCDAALLGRTAFGVAYWLATCALLCSNGLWHLWACCKQRAYSPGVITGIGIYVPLAIYGYLQFLGSGVVSIQTALIAGAIGSSYPVWSAVYHYRHIKRA